MKRKIAINGDGDQTASLTSNGDGDQTASLTSNKRNVASNGVEEEDADEGVDQTTLRTSSERDDDPLHHWTIMLPKLTDALTQICDMSCQSQRTKDLYATTKYIGGFLIYFYRELRLTMPCFVCGLIYMIDLNEKGALKGALPTTYEPTTYENVKTRFLIALLIAAKYYDDDIWSNQKYANMRFMELASLNRDEVEFLQVFHFDMTVTRSRFMDTLTSIGCHGCSVSQFL